MLKPLHVANVAGLVSNLREKTGEPHLNKPAKRPPKNHVEYPHRLPPIGEIADRRLGILADGWQSGNETSRQVANQLAADR